jgi:DNA-binding MarR family transcriptional regulator
MYDRSVDDYLQWFHKHMQEIESAFQKRGSSITFYLISKLLFESDKLSVRDIAKELNLSLSSTTQILNRMEKNKLIQRSHNNMDKRVIFINLTIQGKIVYKTNKIELTPLITNLMKDKQFN